MRRGVGCVVLGLCRRDLLKVCVVPPDHPGEPGELVGEGDGGCVVTTAALDVERPDPESVVGAGGAGLGEHAVGRRG